MSLNKAGYGNHPAFAAPAPPPVAPVVPVQQGFSIPIYWPGDHIFHERYDSVDYYFEPQAETQVYGTFQHQRDEQKGHLLFDRPVVRKLGPDEIVAGLVALYGDRGLRALTGNAIVNERIKLEARKAYVPWRVAECETIVANHEADCTMAVAAKRRPPRPSTSWRQAKIDLDAFERFSVDGKRFVCSKDGMDFDTEGEAFQWVRENYRGTDPKSVIQDTRSNDPKPADVPLSVTVTAGEALQPNPTDHKHTGHEEVDILEAQTNAVFIQAGRTGITLTPDILEGLRSEDREIVALAIEEANKLING